jgi:TatD DNase family protein
MIFDIGANLTDPQFDKDLDNVLDNAKQHGITDIMITSGTLEDVASSVELIEANSDCSIGLSTTIGIHPTRANTVHEDADFESKFQATFLKHRRHVAAFGEMGLDYDRVQFSAPDEQRVVFRRQLQLIDGLQANLPLFLHLRSAFDDFVDIVRQYPQLMRGVVHSFDGSLEQARRLLDDFPHLAIGLNGCSLKGQGHVLAEMLPVERLMVESDAPYCRLPKEFLQQFPPTDAFMHAKVCPYLDP